MKTVRAATGPRVTRVPGRWSPNGLPISSACLNSVLPFADIEDMTLTLRDRDVDRLGAVRAQRAATNLNSAIDAARRLLNTVDDPDVRRLAESFLARQQLAH